jgi:DNA-binding transcriptional regulator YiaG
MKCHECSGDKFETRLVELSTQVGDEVVVDRSVRRPVCVNCGAFTVRANVLEKIELQAAVVAFADPLRVTGGMLRFARKALGLTQTELAARLSVSMESVSRWEREERPMEPWVPLAVLGLVRERLVPCPEGVELRRMG